MKWFGRIGLFIICAVLAVSSSCASVSETNQKYAVVVSANASDPDVYAARILSEYLSALDGHEYPIISDDRSFEGFMFCVGATSLYDTSDIAGRAADSYILAPFDNGLAIYGSGSRGTAYGVFAFLEDFCGYSVYTADSGMVSASGKVTIPEEKKEYHPFFEFRDTDWRSGRSPLYSAANKLNGNPHQTLAPEQGGSIAYLGDFCHTLSTFFCSSDQYYRKHPNYFALHDGKRVPGQLCLTNKSVYKIVLNEVLSLLKDGHDPEADLQIISLSQADNLDYCECKACKALDSANGSHAGSMITFVNRIARAVKEKGYGNVAFDTFAYTYTRKPPSAVAPEDNVIVRFCTFEGCFSHPMDDPGCSSNAELMKDLEEWSGICDHIYIWDYTTNYAHTLGIFPDFRVLQKNLQCFYEHGARGVYEEGNYYIDLCDTEFGDLRSYLIAKLLEDPYCDYEAETLDFCRYYYGEGGEYVKAAIDEITAKTKDHVTIYSPMSETFAMDEEEAEKIDQLWSMAEDAAKSSEARGAIESSKLSWRYVKAALGLREFSGTTAENRDEREALYNDLIAHGVEKIDEWTSIEPDFTEYEMIPVEEWEYAGRFNYLAYDLKGGTDGPPDQWCTIGEIWIPDTVPTREGYRFLGWTDEKNAASADYYPGGFIYPSSDMILYAVWEKVPEQESSKTYQGISEPFSSYDLYIADGKVERQNADSLQNLDSIILRDGGHIRYDDSLRTLFLKDANIIPSNSGDSGTAVSYNSRDDTPLTIFVEGFCRMESRDYGKDSLMALASWGNLSLSLQEGSVLEIAASPTRDKYTNIGIYLDTGRTLTVSGPGTLRVSGGDARPDNGSSFALYIQGDIRFEKDCSVSVISDTASAVSIGCRLEDGDITFTDGSQIQIKGGENDLSYGMQFMNNRDYHFYAENWTGSLTVSGSFGAILGEKGIRLRKDPVQIRLTGYENTGEREPALLEEETYEYKTLQKYAELLFEACEK